MRLFESLGFYLRLLYNIIGLFKIRLSFIFHHHFLSLWTVCWGVLPFATSEEIRWILLHLWQHMVLWPVHLAASSLWALDLRACVALGGRVGSNLEWRPPAFDWLVKGLLLLCSFLSYFSAKLGCWLAFATVKISARPILSAMAWITNCSSNSFKLLRVMGWWNSSA